MKKIFSVISLLALFSFTGKAQSADFNAVKNTEIYFSILRELSLYYVDSIKVDQLVDTGIEAMLNNLDPYTEYVPEEQAEAFDFATTGAYGGMGALIRKDTNGIQVTGPYKGYPADKAGLVPGDCIIEIDGHSTKNLDINKGSDMLKGPAGSTLKLKVIKLKTGDTTDLQLTRVRIHISDVVYSCMMKDSIGYIMLSSFTKNGSKDFADALHALKKTGKMKSLIIDLRSNTGGLLDEAVNIVGMFVPKGTNVVEARGRLKEFEMNYTTKENPTEPTVPIAVLVNNLSASAAEIVAGSLQDLDRGVIIGTRTFGKGLVQSVRDLGYNAKLKLTTAKYYIPSGRCIQIVDYSHRREDGSVGNIPDSLIRAFKTKNGRTVYDGGGIVPDLKTESPSYNKISYSIVGRDLLRPFALRYFIGHHQIESPETFRLSDKEYDEFVDYLLEKDFDDKTETELLFERFLESAKQDKLYDIIKPELDSLQVRLSPDKRQDLYLYRPELQRLLEEEICTIYYYQAGRLRSALPRDPQVEKAVELLQDPEAYRGILHSDE